MTKLEIIEETAAFYNTTNRGFDAEKGCVYLTEDGNHCAVGRCILPEKIDKFKPRELAKVIKGGTSITSLFGISKDYDNFGQPLYFGNDIDAYLKEEYRGHDLIFWRSLQSFHDDEMNWNDQGLSSQGKISKNQLLNRWQVIN